MKSIHVIFLALLSNVVFAQGVVQKNSDNKRLIYPSFTLQNPLSPGTLGTIILAGVVQEKTRLGNKPDGSAELYLGLGKPENLVGAGVTLRIYGLTNSMGEQDNAGKGSLNFHINRLLFSEKLLVDVGIENAVSWGGPEGSRSYITYKPSTYVAANYLFSFSSKTGEPFSYLSLTAGAGNGYFKQDGHSKKPGNNSFDPFFSLATPVIKTTNLIAEWNGYDVGLGVSSI
ncbi:MAG: hypothetical protein EOO10_19925, partial [Chitinophagaceae bacterium]